MDIYTFGRELLRAKDLDPVYTIIWEALSDCEISPTDFRRWLLAYWCFYDVGTSSWIVDNQDRYWEGMKVAAGSSDFPRGRERRHFRGRNANQSVEYLEGRGLSSLFNDLTKSGQGLNAKIAVVKRWKGFGDWIAFKIADMAERLGICSVDFYQSEGSFFSSPVKGALRLWDEERSLSRGSISDLSATKWAVSRIKSELSEEEAPPRYERYINEQEAETILCKWNAYRNGKYHIGEDVTACRKSLGRFADPHLSYESPTAGILLAAGKRGGLW